MATRCSVVAASSEGAPRVALTRLGCRVAQADAEAALEECGARPPAGGVDAVLVTTCVVTAEAESTAFQAVRRAARDHPGVPIVVCGCAGALRRAELEALAGVAAVVGPGDVERTARALRSAAAARVAGGDPSAAARGAARRARPTLKIQDGCDRRCTYCAVPLARGGSRSLPFDAALERLATLGKSADEVVLAGVHLGAYGDDLPHAAGATPALGALVAAVAERGLVHRVRLSSIDPLEVPFDALEAPAAEVLCASFHLPIQSGSDRVLARMGRPYCARDAARVVERISRAMPGACIGADLMTGFPGETEADHRATVALVQSLPLAALHVFAFSPRPGTPAAAMPDAVEDARSRERAAELREISERSWRAYVDGLVGREVEAIVERIVAGEARGTTREGVLARWSVAAGDVPRGRAARLRAAAREGDALRCDVARAAVAGTVAAVVPGV
jgi:threonylcarbamoyladenosine tRNA methylthiotransferase MtaB